ncbi:MAG: TIGR03960 family B12-binding radical SAM protein [Candidatus Omnitrophica bacterium]|nr:TIGR03960 family B12-binding radical SAM protein [Candidatus Omnitrophota bacterium]
MKSHLFLNSIVRPARYVAGEYNLKPLKGAAQVKWCFAFPDVYEVGMSFTGMNLLYGLLNGAEESSCERVFAPWVDAERRLTELGLPLSSLETGTPLGEFDILGFSLQHEMNYTNILTMLSSAGIPLLQAERDHHHPLIIGGGACAYNPEPVADFFDAFVIGDGEEVVLEINRLLAEMPVKSAPRDQLLRALAGIPGVYVPSLYTVSYHSDGTVAGFAKAYPELPLPVEARKVKLSGAYFNSTPMVASTETVHARAAIEVLRGCTRGCRFCQAGYLTRPVRERPSEEIIRLAREMMRNTGLDDLSLLSLSTADHKDLPGIIDGLMEGWDRSLKISLPSLRIDGFDLRVATRLAELHQTGFTFAPEAGTRRLRKVISKDLGEREIFATLEGVFQRGWQTIKLYFQMGLPTETYDDLDGLADLVRRVHDLLVRKVPKRPKLNVSVNPHVSKPFTPFQWFGQDDLRTFQEKIRYLKRILPRGPVNFSYHDPRLSVLEGIMARGDRRVGKAILRAWELGCRFDDWRETFHFDRWMRAFEETGIDIAFYNQRERGKDEVFPWELVSCGVERSYFWLEWTRAMKEKATYDCRDRRGCTLCGICTETYRHDLYPAETLEGGPSLVDLASWLSTGKSEDQAEAAGSDAHQDLCALKSSELEPERNEAPPQEVAVRTLRLRFSKTGPARWLSQLDLQRVLVQTFRRAELPLATSAGFNPRAQLSFAMALPVGTEAYSEWVDVDVRAEGLVDSLRAEDLLARLSGVSAPGITFQEAEWIPAGSPSLAHSARRLVGEVRWIPETPTPEQVYEVLREGIARYEKTGSLLAHRAAREGKPARTVELAPFIESLELELEEGLPVLRATLSVEGGRTVRPDEVALALAGSEPLEPVYLDVRRVALILESNLHALPAVGGNRR